MKKTKIILGAALAAICATSVSVSPVFAKANNKVEKRDARMEQVQQKIVEMKERQEAATMKQASVSAKKAENAQKKISLKKDNSIKEIDRRVESMNKLIEKIKGMKRISDAEKTKLIGQIQTEITNLNNLKATIEADTDPTALTEHKKSIVDSYRIYALFLPKITLIAHADQVIETADLMKAKTTNADALAKIDSGKTKAQSAINAVIDLLPSGYPANKVTLESARKTLASAIKDLNWARPMLSKKAK